MQLVGHQQRVRRLVQLGAERVGRGLPVDEAVPRHRSVRLLLALEQEQRRSRAPSPGRRRPSGRSRSRTGRGRRPRGRSRSTCCPDRPPTPPDPTATPCWRRSRRGRSCPRTPSARWRSRSTRRAARRPASTLIPGSFFGGSLSVASYASQPCLESLARLVEPVLAAPAPPSATAAAWLAPKPSAMRELEVAVVVLRAVRTRAVWTTLPLLAVVYDVVSARAASSCVSPSLAVPAKPLVDFGEGCVERGVDRLGVVAVDRVRRRVRVGGDEDRVAGGGVVRRRVGAAVPAAAATVAVHGRIEAEIEAQVLRSSCSSP